ncbi:Histidine kinase-like ATPase, C-terminal domain containing protein [Rhypophila decipiens]
MPISRLPEATARELGSTLAVSTPVSVVKELLDNSLDAGATFVDIIISFDTLDRIEVRDNGHGISTDDLDLLGRSGCTSKITTFEDVMSLGGKSLGFRGVALASINAVAEVTLTTKTAKDPVATILQLSPGGGIATRRHVSAPAGTTVHVAKLFSRTPVREKVVLRDSKKNLITIKELLQAYALARPHAKLHFRVIRGDQTIPWSYTPKPQGDMKDTIVQLFGTELASSCAERSSTVNQESPTVNDRRSSLIFEAYLPHSFADAIRISKRPFFSVDSRPVSTTRGTLKKLYGIFKMHLSRAMSSSGLTELAKSPFIRLNIRCEPQSYDPNIEPSKDDVLFRDESYIINKFEEFMLSVYPTSPETQAEVILLTPSSTDPQQRNAPLVPTELPRESEFEVCTSSAQLQP